jgi:hypothetical protein
MTSTKAINIKKYYIEKAKQKHINNNLKNKRFKEYKQDSFGPIYHTIRSRIYKVFKLNKI